MTDIRIAETDDEIWQTFELMGQLHPNVLELGSGYLEYVKELRAEVGYQLASFWENERPICVAGFRLCRNLGWGKYLYVDDLVTDKRHRSKGAGKHMLNWLIDHARHEHCVDVRLDAKLERHSAHHFYVRERMDIFAFHFRLRI